MLLSDRLVFLFRSKWEMVKKCFWYVKWASLLSPIIGGILTQHCQFSNFCLQIQYIYRPTLLNHMLVSLFLFWVPPSSTGGADPQSTNSSHLRVWPHWKLCTCECEVHTFCMDKATCGLCERSSQCFSAVTAFLLEHSATLLFGTACGMCNRRRQTWRISSFNRQPFCPFSPPVVRAPSRSTQSSISLTLAVSMLCNPHSERLTRPPAAVGPQ